MTSHDEAAINIAASRVYCYLMSMPTDPSPVQGEVQGSLF